MFSPQSCCWRDELMMQEEKFQMASFMKPADTAGRSRPTLKHNSFSLVYWAGRTFSTLYSLTAIWGCNLPMLISWAVYPITGHPLKQIEGSVSRRSISILDVNLQFQM